MKSNGLASLPLVLRSCRRLAMAFVALIGFIFSSGAQAVRVEEIKIISPLTERGKSITDGLRPTVPMVYVAPSVSTGSAIACSRAITALGDGAVVLLDLSESRNSSDNALKGKELEMQNCLLGGQVEGTYFLVKVSSKAKRILSLESDSLTKSIDLETKLKGWN